MGRKKKKQKAVQPQAISNKGQQLSRRLTQGLLFSGALNIALATSLVYFAVKGKEENKIIQPSFESSQSTLVLDLNKEVSLQSVLEDYSHIEFESLVRLLKDAREVLPGFSQRDLALSVLVHFHNFDVDRAVSGQNIKTSVFTIYAPKEEQIALFSDLSDQTYKHIQAFLKIEQWPFTSRGLFKKLVDGQKDESLKKAFFLTKEFMLLEALLAPVKMQQEDILDLIQQGPWSLVKSFAESKPMVQNFSNTLRIQFISQYIDFASPEAAQWILDIDPNYALQKLSDDRVVALVGLLDQRTPLNENFVLHLALGERSGWVKQEACRVLYHYSNREFKEPFNYQEALEFIAKEYDLSPESTMDETNQHLISANSSSYVELPSKTHEPYSPKQMPAESIHYYVVQKGDCLSKIAKMHDVDLRVLKKANHLDEDLIQVGMTLIIP